MVDLRFSVLTDPSISKPADATEELPTLWYPSGSNDFLVRWPVPSTASASRGPLSATWLSDLAEKLKSGRSSAPECPQTIEDIVNVHFGAESRSARALITFCNKQNLISASLRLSGKKTPPHDRIPTIASNKAFFVCKRDERAKSAYLFSPDATADLILQKLNLLEVKEPNRPLTLTESSTDELKQVHPAGLIVIAGGTGTGKSEIARGIILRWLIRLARQAFRGSVSRSAFSPPHLVTFEDPIENWRVFAYSTDLRDRADPEEISLLQEAESDLRVGLRVTSRAKGYDVDELKSSCLHALRQKPSVVYIGECRQASDWQLALELGGTGHLVVTTCHSSSLVDTFVKLAGKRAGNAQGRQQLGASLLGVIHLKNAELSTTDLSLGNPTELDSTQTFAQLWRQTPESVNNLVVDGLSSLVTDGQNVIARKIMARETLKLQQSGSFDISTDDAFFEKFIPIAEQAAFGLDLRAL